MRQYFILVALLLLIGLLYWSAPLNRCADDACRIGVAVETGNARLCAGLEATRSWCYRDVAVAILDAEVCDAIPEMDSALHCRADVAAAADDLPSCEALGGGARDSCLDAIARSRSAGSLCGGIGVAAFRDICAFDIGLAANDPDSCLDGGREPIVPVRDVRRDGPEQLRAVRAHPAAGQGLVRGERRDEDREPHLVRGCRRHERLQRLPDRDAQEIVACRIGALRSGACRQIPNELTLYAAPGPM